MIVKNQRTKLPALPSVWNPPFETCPRKLPFHAWSKPASSSVRKILRHNVIAFTWRKPNTYMVIMVKQTEKTFLQIVQSLQCVHFTIWVQFPRNWMTLQKQCNCFSSHFSISRYYLEQERLQTLLKNKKVIKRKSQKKYTNNEACNTTLSWKDYEHSKKLFSHAEYKFKWDL